jgi:hypothetical protein
VTRIEGITAVGVFPSGGLISGEVPVMQLDGWTWEENAVRPSAGLFMTFPGGGGGGRGGGGGGGGGGATPPADNPLDQLNRLLASARAYMKNANRTPNWELEAFVPLLERKQSFYVSANTEQSIRDAIAWAEKENVNIVIRTSPAMQTMAALLKAHNVPVILSTVLSTPASADQFHAYHYKAASVFAKAGVPFAFSSGGFEASRLVPFQAGMSVAWGLAPDAAIRAMTLDAAKILGVDSQVGSIETGKLANLVVISGDPLEIKSRIRNVIIAGKDLVLDSKQTDQFKRYMSREK